MPNLPLPTYPSPAPILPPPRASTLQFAGFKGPEEIRAAVLSGSEQLRLEHLSLLLQVRDVAVATAAACPQSCRLNAGLLTMPWFHGPPLPLLLHHCSVLTAPGLSCLRALNSCVPPACRSPPPWRKLKP